ncbi:probable EMP24-Component of the COPII-coated vesicles, 24 kDa [Zygosaccharomyces bailii ISA1307]|nr:probable EMP24-Component of the COPII-coated vesicles, 24 kDa [Zygosaccharomyces bailii ISA1307]
MLAIQAIVTFSFALLVSAHNVVLPPYGRRCFFEELNQGDELSVSFQFGDRDPQSSTQLTGDFLLYEPSGRDILKSFRDVSHGEATITAPSKGKYQYCFGNDGSNIQTKDVTFNVHGVVWIDLDDPHSDTLDTAVRKLSKLIKEVEDEQSYIVIRERTHRNTAESTNDRVKWWSIFQLGVVAVNSLFQIYYLKRFFEVTSMESNLGLLGHNELY